MLVPAARSTASSGETVFRCIGSRPLVPVSMVTERVVAAAVVLAVGVEEGLCMKPIT